MTLRRLASAVLMTAALVLSACGDGDADVQPEAQPSPVIGGFSEGAFDALPRPPTSEAKGEAVEKADVISQSYEVRNRAPERVLEFYKNELRDWTAVGPVEKLGVDTYRGVWRRDNAELTVSSTNAPTLSEPGEARAQYSLSLRKT